MSSNPQPDEHGRFRVRRKGDTSSPAWSTRRFDPVKHVTVPGPASDTYGAALPPKPHRRLDAAPPVPAPPPARPTTTTTTEEDA